MEDKTKEREKDERKMKENKKKESQRDICKCQTFSLSA